MRLKRRQLLVGLGGMAALMVPRFSMAQTTVTMGEIEVTSVSDGSLVLPGSMFFDGLPEAELAQVLQDANVAHDQLTPPCNLTLLRNGAQTVLFDAGSGSGFMPSAGQLLDSLDALDLSADDITHVVFTHGHPDHLWGVLDDFDDTVFPNAQHMMGRVEWDYWRDPNTVDAIGTARASFAVGAARRLEAIEDQFTLFDAGQEILPGVMAHGTYGHTPGHISFEIRAGSDALMVGGDAIGNHHIALARPAWESGADQDPALAAQTRLRLLDQITHDQMLFLGFHIPGGGLGRLDRHNDSYRFIPEAM